MKQLVCLAAGLGIGAYFMHQYDMKSFDENFQAKVDDMEVLLNEEYQKKVAELMARYEGEADIPGEIAELPVPREIRKVLVDYTGGVQGQVDYAARTRIPPEAFSKDFHVEGQPEDAVDGFIPDDPNLPEFLQEVPETVTAADFVEGEAPKRFIPPSRDPVQIVDATAFNENGDDYEEFTITYWAGNGALTNERDEPFTDKNKAQILGHEGLALLQAGPEAFGGSELYIRHTELKSVFEIVWNPGAYTSEAEGA